MSLAWHYTIGLRANSILRDGVIRAATEGLPSGETPVVWFSLRQHWEPTANKGGIGPDGVRRALTMQETLHHGLGGWRFGLSLARLTPYRELKRAAKISPEMARGLERVARAEGADHALWYFSITPVAVADCVVELLDGNEWRPRMPESAHLDAVQDRGRRE